MQCLHCHRNNSNFLQVVPECLHYLLMMFAHQGVEKPEQLEYTLDCANGHEL